MQGDRQGAVVIFVPLARCRRPLVGFRWHWPDGIDRITIVINCAARIRRILVHVPIKWVVVTVVTERRGDKSRQRKMRAGEIVWK